MPTLNGPNIIYYIRLSYSSLAQSVEHAAVNRRVVCSSQTGGATKRYCRHEYRDGNARNYTTSIPDVAIAFCLGQKRQGTTRAFSSVG